MWEGVSHSEEMKGREEDEAMAGKMGDERLDIRSGDEKIEGEGRGIERGRGGRRSIQMRGRFGLLCLFIIHADTELLFKTRPAEKSNSPQVKLF